MSNPLYDEIDRLRGRVRTLEKQRDAAIRDLGEWSRKAGRLEEEFAKEQALFDEMNEQRQKLILEKDDLVRKGEEAITRLEAEAGKDMFLSHNAHLTTDQNIHLGSGQARKECAAMLRTIVNGGKEDEETFCPECGFNVKVDEDGCCVHCGATATGSAVADPTRTREALKRLKADVKDALDPLNWITATGQKVANYAVKFRLYDALDRAERVEKEGTNENKHRHNL